MQASILYLNARFKIPAYPVGKSEYNQSTIQNVGPSGFHTWL